MKTISEVLASLNNRAIPKTPCSFALYTRGEILPFVVTHDVRTVVAEDVVISVVETDETIAFVEGTWRVVGKTRSDLCAIILA